MRTSEAYGHSYCSNITSHMNELSKANVGEAYQRPESASGRGFLELRLCNRDQDNLAQQLRHCKALGRDQSKTM